MSLNWVEIDKVLEELPLEGCFLQNIRQSSFHHIILDLYRPGRTIHLLICLERSSLRLHETERRFKSLAKPPRFTSFLRSRIKGCRIEEVCQLGRERIVRIILRKGDEHYKLYIRLWGGASNLLLCDPRGKILDAFSRRPARDEVPGKYYQPEEMDIKPSARKFSLKEEGLKENLTYNLFLDRYYTDEEAHADLHQLKQNAERALDQLESQYQAGLKGLRTRLAEYEKEEEQRHKGDLLMGALTVLKKGDREYQSEEETVALDPRKSPVENAQDYYKRAGKASRGRAMTEEEVLLLEEKLRTIEESRQIINDSKDPEKIRSLTPDENVSQTGNTVKKTPGLSFSSGGFTLLSGRNARENDALLRQYVRGNDYWLHTRDYAGGYIFIRAPRGKSIPLDVLLDAGNLAVFYSKAKKAGQGDVYYTQVKYLRRPKEGKKGLVLPTKEKNLYIKLDKNRISRLRKALV
ncbi:MAG: hypothetical protein B6241_07765 [Spirochaetaceae bacterium 4572_59]|nr:MAG: hypothetical protein B6241_07765 [Spirochaetaceae bacterium 4572_59]